MATFYDRDGNEIDLDALAARFRQEQDARATRIARELAGLTPAQALLRLQGIRAADEAAEIAAGWRHLTVVHGPLDDECIGPFRALNAEVDAACEGRPYRSRGNSDETTWMIQGDDAAAVIDQLTEAAMRLNPGWWHIRQST